MSKRLQVALMMGGHSAEREVSLRSGDAVGNALEKLGHEVHRFNDIHELKPHINHVDVAFNILHGADGEDGQLAAWFEKEGIKYTGCNHISGALSWHKDKAKILVSAAGVSTPESQTLTHVDELQVKGGGPWIVKPVGEGSSVGLYKVDDAQALTDAVQESLNVVDAVLVERFVSGTECTVGVVGNQVMPVVAIVPASGLYDYQAKYQSDQTQYHCPAPFSTACQEALQADAVKVFKALGLSGWGRVDFIVDEQGNRWFLEANTTPGMTESSLLPKAAAVHGWSFDELVGQILETAEVFDE